MCWRTSSATWKWGESPEEAAEKGGAEVALPVLAATLTTVVVFFPVTFLYGVSQFLFTALALSVVLSLCRFLHGGDDGRAAVLREAHQGPCRARGGCARARRVMMPPGMTANPFTTTSPAPRQWDRNGYREPAPAEKPRGWGVRFNDWFNGKFNRFPRLV